MTLTRYARPKVNLFLHVTGKRVDGYHLLESLVCFPEGGDVVTVSPMDTLKFQSSGPYSAEMGNPHDNLVLRAAALLQADYGIKEGAEIQLQKNLPVASGIGGGSSDAAATLHLLNDLWHLSAPIKDLMRIGEKLGADVPVCLHHEAAIMSGIGTDITPVAFLPSFYILLVNPGVAVATPSVFSSLLNMSPPRDVPDFSTVSLTGFVDFLHQCTNDLQAGALQIAPQIGPVLTALERCENTLLARMSGSGATCFGLFKTLADANKAKNTLLSENPHWWCLASAVAS